MINLNFTILSNKSLEKDFDHFGEVFSDETLNYFTFFVFVLGLFNCFPVCLMSWFERTGRAGPYRTLRNRLMTSNFEQMILRYIIPGSIFNLRLLWGPLPETLCKMVTAFGVFNGINISILSFATTATKFAFIVWFRTIPVMDDNFLAFFINLNLTLLSILATFSKMMLQPSPTTVEVHFNIFLTFSFF